MIESDRVIYFEDDTSTNQGPREIVFKEHSGFIPVPIISTPISSLVVDQHPIATTNDEPIKDVDRHECVYVKSYAYVHKCTRHLK